MSSFTHFLAALFFVGLFKLSGKQELIAFLFGVGPDIDEVIQFVFSKKRQVRVIKRYPFLKTNVSRSFFQEPISLLWIAPLSVCLHSWLPVAFFLLHLSLDYPRNFSKRPFYPLWPLEIKGSWPRFFNKVGEGWKEGIAFSFFLILNLLLIL
jgi:hypothetical protein